MKFVRIKMGLLIVCITLNQQLVGQAITAEEQRRIDQIFEDFDHPTRPGAGLCIMKDGEVIWKKGYGSANLEYEIPVQPHTVFHVASVSKQFTVFSLLLLEEEGKLSFDDDIRKFIPELPSFGTTITLRHLASHTSGLRDHWDLYCLAGGRMDDAITNDHLLKLIVRQQELNFIPGEKYWYSNTGYTLLAEVIERVSGQTLAAFTQKRIFEPLGMKNSQFYDDHEKIVPNRAYSYEQRGDSYKKRVLSFSITGSTSVFTTLDDISAWVLNFESPKVGNAEILAKMG
ncbi:MAG: serine hydrolase domain-containing protein, partial [Bacteroidota bacterium]